MIVPMVVDYLTGLSASSSDSRLRVLGFSALIQFCLMSKEIIESWYEKKFWFSDKEFEGFIGQLQRLASYFATTTNQYRERPRIDELTLTAQEPITALVYVQFKMNFQLQQWK